jgi:hypothetical protein
VLPLENLSADPDNAYFANGIQEEILTRLAGIADLKVISRSSTQQYQSKPRNLREIARQLGVATILEGSVQKAAGHRATMIVPGRCLARSCSNEQIKRVKGNATHLRHSLSRSDGVPRAGLLGNGRQLFSLKTQN